MAYCALYQSYEELKLNLVQNAAAPEVIDGDKFLIAAQDYVTRRIDQETQSTFAPYLTTRYYDAGLNSDNIDWYQNQLFLHFPLLETLEVKVLDNTLIEWDGTQSTYADAAYYTTPRDKTPYYKLQGMQAPFSVWNPYFYGAPINPLQAFLQSISVRALWGYREFYLREGWKSSGDSIQNGSGINSSTTSIIVNSINGVQYNNVTPRFSIGQWIKVTTGDDYEFMEIVDTDVSGSPAVNTLTVIRGVRGTDAIAHNKNDTIDIWYPQPEIVRCAQRWVAYLYARRATFEQVTLQLGQGGQYSSVFPQDVPPECQNILQLFKNQEPVSAV